MLPYKRQPLPCILVRIEKYEIYENWFSQRTRDLEENERLMQFLMGLNEVYEAIPGQILVIDPLPSECKSCNKTQHYKPRNNTFSGTGGYKERKSKQEKMLLHCEINLVL